MSTRRLTVLGTASQVPTPRRNQTGYFLSWDGEGLLFDPGEGTQIQMARFGIAASARSSSPISMATTAWAWPG